MAMSLASLLVVDDDDALVRMLTEAAETRGYQVGCATSMAAACCGGSSARRSSTR